MDDHIINYRNNFEYTKLINEFSSSSNLTNEFIKIPFQLNRLFNILNDTPVFIQNQIQHTKLYQNNLVKIVCSNTPFRTLISIHRYEFNKLSEAIKSPSILDTKSKFKRWLSPTEETYCNKYGSNHIRDTAIAKVLKAALIIVRQHINKTSSILSNSDHLFQVIEDSIQELPQPSFSQSMDILFMSSIEEIKSFLYSLLPTGKSVQRIIELTLLLYTKLGSLSVFLEWIDSVIDHVSNSDSLVRTEILYVVLQSVLIGDGSLTNEIKGHVEDCIDVDMAEKEVVTLQEAIDIMFIVVLRLCKIDQNLDDMSMGRNYEREINPFSDIYIWVCDHEIDQIKAAYPDSLSTRLKSFSEKPYNKQVICSQNELIMVNSLGEVSSRFISKANSKYSCFKKFLCPCWLSIQFPDSNIKIDHISVGFASGTTGDRQHILALTKNGQVFSWGGGQHGKLGHGDLEDLDSPKLIFGLCGYIVKQISTGVDHSAAVTDTGLSFIWGDGSSFNNDNDNHCLIPKRLKQGIMSKIICGPYCTFIVGFNQREITYMGASCPERVCYTDHFLLPVHPNPIRWESTDNEQKLSEVNCEKIQKVVANSSGILALLSNGRLYSLGLGLILGCPNCELHKSFERVKSMIDVNVLDFAISETHVVVLEKDIIYSWSLNASVLVLIKQSLTHFMTNVSATSLSEVDKEIIFAWYAKDEPQNRCLATKQSNVYLNSRSRHSTIQSFKQIFQRYTMTDVDNLLFFGKTVHNSLELLIYCMKSDQFCDVYLDMIEFTEAKELLQILLTILDRMTIKKQTTNTIIEAIVILSKVVYHCLEERGNGLLTLLSSVKSLSLLDSGQRLLLETLLHSFVNPEHSENKYSTLYKLSIDTLSDLLICACHIISGDTIAHVQEHLNAKRTDGLIDQSMSSLYKILNQFATIGYRTYLIRNMDHNAITHNPVSNLCRFLPMVNSVIYCMKSYLHHVQTKDKFTQWIVTNSAKSVNSLFSRSPMGWILFDVLFFLLEDQHNVDVFSLIPHIGSTIVSLNEINTMLPGTVICDKQEIHFPLYGFPSSSNPSYSLQESAIGWIWLLDVQRLSGLLYGKLLSKIINSVEFSVDDQLVDWLKSPLFIYIGQLVQRRKTTDINTYCHINDFDRMLAILLLADVDRYKLWSKNGIFYSTGLQIYTTIVDLITSKLSHLDFEIILKFYGIMSIFDKVINSVQNAISNILGLDLFSNFSSLTAEELSKVEVYAQNIRDKCLCLQNLLFESVKHCQYEYVNKTNSMSSIRLSIQICSTEYLDALDLRYLKPSKNSRCSNIPKQVQSGIDYNVIQECSRWLKEIYPSFDQFLTTYAPKAVTGDLSKLSHALFVKKTKYNRVIKTIKEIEKLFDMSTELMDSVFIQIINEMMQSTTITGPLSDDQIYILDSMFTIVLRKLKASNEKCDFSAISLRLSASILGFLSQFNFTHSKFIKRIVDANAFGCIRTIISNRPLIATDNWLIIEGNGDENLRNVSNLISWCFIEDVLLNLSLYPVDISDDVKVQLEGNIIDLVDDIYQQVNDCVFRKIFDLHVILILVKFLYERTNFFHSTCYQDRWIDVLMKISIIRQEDDAFNMFYSKYAINVSAMNLFGDMLCDMIETDEAEVICQLLEKTKTQFAEFYYYLLTTVPKLDTERLIESIECRLNSFKDIRSNESGSPCNKWIFGNANFDRDRTFYCDILTSEKISVSTSDSIQFMALTHEIMVSGVWQVTIDVSCTDSQIEFSCGFIMNDELQWPTDYQTLMNLRKVVQPISLSSKGSLMQRIECVIDIDECIVYFLNIYSGVQTFSGNERFYRFFLRFSVNSLLPRSAYEIHVVSLKQIAHSHGRDINNIYNNSSICPDNYIVRSKLSETLIKCCDKKPETIFTMIVKPLMEHCKCCHNIEFYSEKKITEPSLSVNVIFELFLLCGISKQHRHYRGETCTYVTQDSDGDHKGIILNFKTKSTSKFVGLNFVDKLIDNSDIYCKMYSLSTNSPLIIPIKCLVKDEIYDESLLSKYFKILFPGHIEDVMTLLSNLLKCVPSQFYDVDVCNFEEMLWCSDSSNGVTIEYHFLRCLISDLFLQIVCHDQFIDYLSHPRNDIVEKNFNLIYRNIVRMATKASPIKQVFDSSDFMCCSFKLMEGFLVMDSEIAMAVAKKYAKLFLKSNNFSDLGTHISKTEREILFRALRRSHTKEFIDSLVSHSSNPLSVADGRSVTFTFRRRVLDSSITTDLLDGLQHLAPLQNEYDINSAEYIQIQEVNPLMQFGDHHYDNQTPRQRLIHDFFTIQNSKNKTSRNCPICNVVVKSESGSVFSHLSLKHSHNCRKSFQHQACKGIDFDGNCHDIDTRSLLCATVTDRLYCVCSDYLTRRIVTNESRGDYASFVKEHFETNLLVGWPGTLSSEHFFYQKMSDVKIYQPVKRPEVDEVSILGDNVHNEINESKTVFDQKEPNDNAMVNKQICVEVPFVCQLNSSAIATALVRLQYSNLVISSRKIILQLIKQIYARGYKKDVCAMIERYGLHDLTFVCDTIRLVEWDRFNFDNSVPNIINGVQTVNFVKEDFLSTIVMAFENSLRTSDQIHCFVKVYSDMLENHVTSVNEYFNLSKDCDKTILIAPSRLLTQIFAHSLTRILSSIQSGNIDYKYWQEDVEKLLELYSFGAINDICCARDKIWCLDNIKKIFNLILKREAFDDVNYADLFDDLSTDDSQVVYLANANVKKMISTKNRQLLVTADGEGTVRIWDIDSKMGIQQHLQHTLLFSLGKVEPDDAVNELNTELYVFTNDVSDYLRKVAFQRIAVSFNGVYVAETIGVYLNIWSTKSVFSQPQQVTLPSVVTALHFPELTFNGIYGAPADQLLIGLSSGQVILLRILDNGSRITQKFIKTRSEENIPISTLAWDNEHNAIALGYNDGVIVLTDQRLDTESTILETIHYKSINQLLYCPHSTKFGKHLLASSAVGENRIVIWNITRIVCVISLSDPVTFIEWLSEKFVTTPDMSMIISGNDSGLIEFWKFDESGNVVQNMITFSGHVYAISHLQVCDNSGLLISGCINGFVNVWHIKDQSLLSTFRGCNPVIGAQWTPQNNLVVAWPHSQYVHIWQHFNDLAFQKNGLRQWALVRNIMLRYAHVRTIKHLENLKTFIMSINRIIIQQFNDEESFVKCGYSIVYSQYLQALIKFIFSLHLLPSFIPCINSTYFDIVNSQPTTTIHRQLTSDNIYQRRNLCHSLNRNKCLTRFIDYNIDWLFDVDEVITLTRAICFEVEPAIDLIPKWWWNWCFESEAFVHQYVEAKWQNRHWTWEMQSELNNWYKCSPEQWISNYKSSTYVWGCGKKGELSIVTKKDFDKPTELKMDGIQQVICGNSLTLVINNNGNLWACGEGLEIVFNPYLREDSSKMILVPVLCDYTITHVAVSKGSESHIIAITSSGDVYSWGVGSYGKLGHGHGSSLKKPKLIEGLRGKNAVQADCGHMHSAVVTASGKLYTFGLGASGQLGVEILTGSDMPRLVTFDDDDVKIGYVSCGSTHTLALTQDGTGLYALGDGSYGKLGLGDFDNRYSPVRINLKKVTLIKIACGNNFNGALTDKGDVLTWGHCDFVGQNEQSNDDNSNHVTVPTLNNYLVNEGVVIIDISCGNDVTFAVSTTGLIYGWGSNSNNLLLSATKSHVYLPELINIGKKTNYKQISCGRYHVAASCHSPHSYRYDIPTGPQLINNASDYIDSSLYPTLARSDLNRFDLTARLILLLYWNELVRLTWQFWMPLTNQKFSIPNNDCDILSNDAVWPLISSQSYLLPESSWTCMPFNNFRTTRLRSLLLDGQINNAQYRYIAGSMITNKTYGSLVKISRIGKIESVFSQTCHQVLRMYPMELRLPWRAWKVKLVQEGADDAGGAYDETISEMCAELQSFDSNLNILIPSPSDSTVYLPNPDPNVCQKYFKFLGILMGTANRTKKPIDLNLDPLFWKLMTRSLITVEDLRRIDPAYFNSLLSLTSVTGCSDNYLKEVLSIDNFVVFSINQSANEIVYQGLQRDVNHCNLSTYAQHAISFRLHEFDRCIAHIRDGYAGVSPLLFLDLMSWQQLERAVCGARTINVSTLKSIARYVDADEKHELFLWFWDIIEQFTESEKSLFLRFVTGKSRLPSENAKIPFRLFIYLSKQPVTSLPQAQTCFNQIRIPRYTSRSELELRLKFAISQCRSIDMDDYMLARNRDS